jgi:hypothetical protein
MNISIDFDDTFTADRLLFTHFIRIAKEQGHNVYCVTMRHPTDSEEVYNSIGKLIGKDHCIFTEGKAKELFCFTKGITIDVWIDDMPGAILKNRKPQE